MTVRNKNPVSILLLLSVCALTYGELGNIANIQSSGVIVYPTHKEESFELIRRATLSHSFRNVELEEIAENFDLICCFPKYFGSRVRELRALNPDLLALVYRNFRAVYETSSSEFQLALDKGWILKDSAGSMVRSTKWKQNVMVDIGDPEYQDFVANWVKETIDQYGYDGVYLDNGFSVRKLEMWFDLTAQPINPRTGREWTGGEIKKACIEVHNKLRKTIGSKLDVANGIYHGRRFRESYDDYVDFLTNSAIDGLMGEGIWFTYNGRWLTAQEWCESLDFLIWVQDNFLTNNRIFLMKCDVTKGTLPRNSTYYQMIDYAFASSLLGVRGENNYIIFFSAYNHENFFLNDHVKNLHGLAIGKPLNDYYQIERTFVYCRDFTNARVLVNPTGTSYAVELGGIFETLDGEKISFVNLSSHSGAILLKGL